MRYLLSILLAFFSTAIPWVDTEVKPPVARVVAKKLEKHGHVRIDLEAENEYTQAMMAHTKGLQETLFREFKTRIKQTDISVPYKQDDYYYYTRTEEGKNYPIYCRKKGSLDAPEEVILDVNKVAEGQRFCAVSRPEISSGQDLLAYGVDTVGRRFYSMHVRNLGTGESFKDVIPDVTGNAAWANDNKTLFYAKQDPTTLRSHRIYRHALGTDPAKDDLVYEEKDETFECEVFKTKSKKYLMIASVQTLGSEFRYLDAGQPAGPFQVFLPRRRNHEYEVDHYEGRFYIRTNHKAKNFRLMKTPVTRTAMQHWQEVIPHRGDVFLEGLEIFKDHLVVSERKNGLIHLRVVPWSGAGEHYLDFGEPAYVVFPLENYQFETPRLRYTYSSMTTPVSVYDYNMVTREKKLLKREEVLGGFDSNNYKTERIYAAAKDGKRIPISLVYRNALFKKDGANALLLYGYGSYGASMDAGFDPFRISLLDRGFVYAIAHVRGGQELGRQWYEDGKLLKKRNTFTDFIACAEHLIREKYTGPKRVFAWGGSAGGLLMGAVVTMRPDLFTGVVAQVPFVDVLTTMLDESIPLTSNEYDEWGNPNDEKYYEYMLSYSPYDQTRPANYPHLLVTAGLHDSQVQYWEPAKWVAKLRAVKQNNNRLLLKTEMKAGHGGLTARDDRYRELAFRYAFLLDLAGATK